MPRNLRLSALCLALLCLAAGPLPAQGIGSKPSPSASPAALPGEDALRERLRAAEAELQKVLPPPAGVPAEEAHARRESIEAVVALSRRAVDEAQRAAAIAEERKAAEAALAAWGGFDRPAPYPIFLVDWYRDARTTARAIRDSQRTAERLHATQLEASREAAQQAGSELRAAEERIVPGAAGPAADALQWRLDAARWKERAAVAQYEFDQLRAFNAGQRVARRTADHALLDRQVGVLREAVVFRQEDLDKVLGELGKETARVRAERERALAQSGVAADAVASAERALSQSGDGEAGRLALEKARLKQETADVRLEVLSGLEGMVEQEIWVWKGRFAFHSGKGEERPRKLREELGRLQAQISQWQEYLRGRMEANAALLVNVGEGSGEAGSKAGGAAEAAVRDELFRRAGAGLRRLQLLADRWREEVDERIAATTLGDRAAEAAGSWRDLLRRLWDFELFTAEQNVVVDGKTVSVRRGVTVRKIVFALLVLLAGWFAARGIGGMVERLARARAGVSSTVATALRRWVFVVGVLVSILVAFVVAKIPLTAFAFLGGAIAIGVGFGAQNLMSNFISGLILLFERPIRLGDIVQVDGQAGTVQHVGLRASTIRRADGIELIVPNRDFLEKTVVNSTLSDRRLRYAISIGVDYGSPTRTVRDLLVRMAETHGGVLKEPGPQVYFEDFGADALQFTLYYWVDLGRVADPRLVASDLRFLIDAGLAEAGIGISFPQRDVHLHSAQPIRVQVDRGDGS